MRIQNAPAVDIPPPGFAIPARKEQGTNSGVPASFHAAPHHPSRGSSLLSTSRSRRQADLYGHEKQIFALEQFFALAHKAPPCPPFGQRSAVPPQVLTGPGELLYVR